MSSRNARGTEEAYPCLCSLVAKNLKEDCAFAGIVCGNALILPGKHLQKHAADSGPCSFPALCAKHTSQSNPQHPNKFVEHLMAVDPDEMLNGQPHESRREACCKLFTLHGLQDWALHMRTTMLLSALSSSPLSCAGECTCTYDGVL